VRNTQPNLMSMERARCGPRLPTFCSVVPPCGVNPYCGDSCLLGRDDDHSSETDYGVSVFLLDCHPMARVNPDSDHVDTPHAISHSDLPIIHILLREAEIDLGPSNEAANGVNALLEAKWSDLAKTILISVNGMCCTRCSSFIVFKCRQACLLLFSRLFSFRPRPTPTEWHQYVK